MRRVALVLGLIPLCWYSLAAAQNYRELPIGGRTATMGGAATAAGNDSAMPYLNPAGMAGIPGDIFAISATAYSYTHRAFENYFFPSGTQPLLGYRVERESFATSSVGELPSSVMYFSHLSPPKAKVQHHAGVALVIPAARQIELVASVAGQLDNVAGESLETSSINAQYRRYYLGPSYAVGVGDRFRFGVSGFVVFQRGILTDAMTSSTSILGGTAGATISGQNSQLTEGWSVVPIAGLQLRLVSDLWVGLGVAAPGLPLAGRMRFTSDTTGVSIDPNSGAPLATSQTSTADVDYSYADPFRLNAGIAFDRRDAWSLAADIHYYFGRTSSEVDGVQEFEARQSGEITRSYGRRISYTTEAEPVLDFSLGGEVAVNQVVTLRGGVFSDLTASPELLARDEDIGRLRLDRYGGSLGLGLKLGSFDTTTGAILMRGTGKYGAADTWITAGVVPVPSTETTFMLVLSGAVTVEEAQRQIRETVPFDTRVLLDFGPGGPAKPRAPRIPLPLPPEPKPALPQLWPVEPSPAPVPSPAQPGIAPAPPAPAPVEPGAAPPAGVP